MATTWDKNTPNRSRKLYISWHMNKQSEVEKLVNIKLLISRKKQIMMVLELVRSSTVRCFQKQPKVVTKTALILNYSLQTQML